MISEMFFIVFSQMKSLRDKSRADPLQWRRLALKARQAYDRT
jgi:hypothetical protein